MATPLTRQKADLEAELADTAINGTVRQALQAQLVAINKKLAAGSARTAISGDGNVIKIGDLVHTAHIPYFSRSSYGTNAEPTIQPPTISSRTIAKINPSGEITFDTYGRVSYCSPKTWFTTIEGINEYMKEQLAKRLAYDERTLEEATKNVKEVKTLIAWLEENPATFDRLNRLKAVAS
jgi:hypothetical protein